MPQVSGLDVLAAVKEQDPETPVILMTAQASLQSAIQAVNQGAFQYIQKPFPNDYLLEVCRRALEHRRIRFENRSLKSEVREGPAGAAQPIGTSRRFVEGRSEEGRVGEEGRSRGAP